MNEMIERHARAYNPVGWAWYDRAEDDHPAKPVFREREEKQSRAAIGALCEPDGLAELCRRAADPQTGDVCWLGVSVHRAVDIVQAVLGEALK